MKQACIDTHALIWYLTRCCVARPEAVLVADRLAVRGFACSEGRARSGHVAISHDRTRNNEPRSGRFKKLTPVGRLA